MFKIVKCNGDCVIDFAATELKKYMRMMITDSGEIPISDGDINSKGLLLGTFSDFGLKSNVEDVRLDDEIYIKTTGDDGIIAGTNPRAVLIAVYRFLKENGCRWLFPGPEGEVIPERKALLPVKYSHKASLRYRGQCNEGAETQYAMQDAIDFTPKIGLNCFMLEFAVPAVYYNRFFDHEYGEYKESRPTNGEIVQWKRACETEISKRGLLFHDMGHGWTSEPFGMSSIGGWRNKIKDEDVPKNARKHLAMLNGKRGLYLDAGILTNLCMSQAETRKIVADAVADYAEAQTNVDFLHVWLSDGSNNHCECEECRKMDTSDWYMVMMNDIDEELSKRSISTHIVFIAYVDTIWAPKQIKLKNPNRFTMLYAPITRKYTETYLFDADEAAVKPYMRNKLSMPAGMSENLAYLKEWKKLWQGDCFCYEYHFWRAQYCDLGGMFLPKIIYDDIHGQKKNGLSGIIEDGSQRSFFPNGFRFYLYGEALFDEAASMEKLTEEYFSAAYGEDWKLVYDYLNEISDEAMFKYIYNTMVASETARSKVNDEEILKKCNAVRQTVANFEQVIFDHKTNCRHTEFVMWDLLDWHRKYIQIILDAIENRINKNSSANVEVFNRLKQLMAPLNYIRHSAYDFDLNMIIIFNLFKPVEEAKVFD